MSGAPASTPGPANPATYCPVCGLEWQVRNCKPGKCGTAALAGAPVKWCPVCKLEQGDPVLHVALYGHALYERLAAPAAAPQGKGTP